MLNTIFNSVLTSGSIEPTQFLLIIAVSLFLGVFYAFIHSFHTRSSKGFRITLALLPSVVAVVILMVNGSIGAGIAVAGTFSLVRFRSLPGTAREIGSLFLAMGTGLITGMGYLAYGVLFAFCMGGALLVFVTLFESLDRSSQVEKILRITIPENLDYNEVFDEILSRYTTYAESLSVKTTNMGSMYKLTYAITMKDAKEEKEMIDALRCRNGNLEISLSRKESGNNEL